MDNGRPFRIARPDGTAGRPSARPVATRSSEAGPIAEEQTVVQQKDKLPAVAEPSKEKAIETKKVRPPREKRSVKKYGIGAVMIGLIALIAVIFFFVWPLLSVQNLPGANTYQAVTMVDGQIYFGKVKSIGREYVEINDGYYLQPATSESSASGQPDTGKLVRLSNRLYAPSGNIIIPIHQVISFEPLDPDGQIVQMMGKDD